MISPMLPRLTFILPLALAACSSGTNAVCPCPSGGRSSVLLPMSPTIAIDGVSTDPPCSATPENGHVIVTSQDTATCHVRAHMTNGDTYAFDVDFRKSGTGCCGNVAFPVDASTPERVDAGAP